MTHHWTTRRQLALALFEWIECWYNASRPALLNPDAQLHRLRNQRDPSRNRGMITTTNPSAVTGKAHTDQ